MASKPAWWQNMVLYAIDVATFTGSDADGIGDLPGVRSRLGYLSALGVDCLWLQPFYLSPRHDGGYDVADHCAVDPRFGNDADLAGLLDDAHRAGMRVVVDLVASHTSDQHPWFQASRRGEGEFAEFYVWRDEPDRSLGVEQIFPGVVGDVWSFDSRRGAWYLHRFYAHEPDLNTANPAVRDETFEIARFWLSRGVDGFRVDAAPYLAQKAAWADPRDDGHWFLRDLRRVVDAVNPEAVLIAEADVATAAYDAFLADGAGMNLVFNFHTNNHLFLALARRDAEPVARSLRELVEAGAACGLVNWVRNHDELDLERLSDAERDEVYRAFAPDEDMRVYGRGIRRRLPPMVDGDRSLIELAFNATFSLPGVPAMRYGEEIGMGDDLARPERLAVRTAMQWTDGPNAGFSDADPAQLQVALVNEGPFAPPQVNVAGQLDDPSSLLGRLRALVAVRRLCPEIGAHPPEVVPGTAPGVLVLRYRGPHRTVVIAHNFGTATATVDVGGAHMEVLFPRRGTLAGPVTLDPAASVWLSTDDEP